MSRISCLSLPAGTWPREKPIRPSQPLSRASLRNMRGPRGYQASSQDAYVSRLVMIGSGIANPQQNGCHGRALVNAIGRSDIVVHGGEHECGRVAEVLERAPERLG